MPQVQGSLFPGIQLKQETRRKYLSLQREGSPFRSKIKDSFDSIPHIGKNLDPNRLDQFIAEATSLLKEDTINKRLSGRPKARKQALQGAYFYLMQAHFYRSLDNTRSEKFRGHDEKMQRQYSSIQIWRLNFSNNTNLRDFP